jgi:tRNA pseudouridine55 synthase
MMKALPEGVLLLNKPKGKTSFALVSALRTLTGVKKIGHAGTLDPLATGVMVMLIGKNYTKQSNYYLSDDKEYLATLCLGASTTTFDKEGPIVNTSKKIPALEELLLALSSFQGKILQTPPMFSAKKIGGKKLCDLARKGIEIQRSPQEVTLLCALKEYQYPRLILQIACSKGTYIRSIANDLGEALGCFAYLDDLVRLRSGSFDIKDCLDLDDLIKDPSLLYHHLKPLRNNSYV